MSESKRASVGQRLLLLTVTPILIGFLFALELLFDARNQLKDAEQTGEVMQLAVSIGELVHRLQIERGSTAGFVQSQGAKFADVLPKFRSETDQRLETYRARSTQISFQPSTQTTAAIEQASTKLQQLTDIRSRANGLSLPATESTAYFSQTIAALLDVITTASQASADPHISRQTAAYVALLMAKENAGQERAMTTAAFVADRAEPAQFRGILQRVHAQDAFAKTFAAYALPAELESFQKALTSSAANEVNQYRNSLIEHAQSGGFGVEPGTWFKSITAKIDALHETENLVAAEIIQTANSRLDKARNTLILTAVMGLLAAGVSITVALALARSIANPLKNTVAVVNASVSQNNFTQAIPEAGVQRWLKPPTPLTY